MANVDRPFGFLAQAPLVHVGEYTVDASNGTAFFLNDMVSLESDGRATPATAGDAVMVGASISRLAASTAGDVNVVDSPLQRYVVQSAGSPTQDNVGNYADHVAGTGNASTGLSGHELASSMTTTLTGFLILDIVNAPDNAAGANARVRVQLYDHIWGKTGV